MVSGISHETSDMDIGITGLPIYDKNALAPFVQTLQLAIAEKCFIKQTNYIETAKIPVLKIVIIFYK